MSSKAAEETTPVESVPREFGPIMVSEWLALPEDVRQRRAKRGYERFLALKGKIYIELDIDEARGRNR
jgi:hypothetical protein